MFTSWLKIARAVVAFASLCGCVSGIHQVSERVPQLDSKEGADFFRSTGRQAIDPVATPELYVKKSVKSVTPLEDIRSPGSLYSLEDERNELFNTVNQADLGDFVTVNLNANRQGKGNDAQAEDADKTAAAAPMSAADEALVIGAVPSLTPAKGEEAPLMKQVKMRVVHRFPNGDVLAMYERRSSSEADAHVLTIQARVPYAALMEARAVGSNELSDVKVVESFEGEVTEKTSLAWEEEYSLRLSGFSEAKSRYAMQLEEKRIELDEARLKLDDRLKILGRERQKIAKERDQLLTERKTDREKIALLQANLAEQQAKNGEDGKAAQGGGADANANATKAISANASAADANAAKANAANANADAANAKADAANAKSDAANAKAEANAANNS